MRKQPKGLYYEEGKDENLVRLNSRVRRGLNKKLLTQSASDFEDVRICKVNLNTVGKFIKRKIGGVL